VTSRGLFVVLEGLDGAGTTTQAAALVERLGRAGPPAVATFEPSDGAIGRVIRGMLTAGRPPDPQVLALLFAADRLEHLSTVIRARTDAGTHVLCDRYVLSSLAYQASEDVSLDWLGELNWHATPPDVTVFVDASVETCMSRIRGRADDTDHFHHEGRLRRVEQAYREVLASTSLTGRLVLADGEAPVEAVTEQIWAELQPLLSEGSRPPL
jgi:dTMP kinase